MTWQETFKQFHDKDEHKGSAAWFVSPNIIKMNIERWIKEAKQEAYRKALDGLDLSSIPRPVEYEMRGVTWNEINDEYRKRIAKRREELNI